MKRKQLFFGLTFLLIGLIIGLLLSARFNASPLAQSQDIKPETRFSAEELSLENAISNVANTTGKAVVSISTEHTAKIGEGRRYSFGYPFGGESPFGEDEFFRKFFDEFFGETPQREYKQIGLGSGVIIDAEGYILTNEHVIGDADKITVTLSDGREFKGEIKGQDQRSDLAIIKINAHNLPVALLGDSDSVKIGQWVVAIGNPFGFAMQNPEPTVTAGVISALHRSLGRGLSRERDYSDLIQTDAAINPGNSGGPLVNIKGEIIGINVAIVSTTGGYQGIGFAVPINTAKRIVSRLIEGKKVLYGWLGVTVQDLTEDLAKHFGLSEKNGVLVAGVVENGPSQKGGIKEGDIIKEFDNKPVNNVRTLLSIVGKTEVGRRVKVSIARNKKELSLEVEVAERPQDLEKAGLDEKTGRWLGLEVEDLTPQNIKRFQLEDKKGVVIVNIEPSSPADDSGLSAGDVILEINKQPVKSLSEYTQIIKAAKGDCLIRTARGYFLVKEGGE